MLSFSNLFNLVVYTQPYLWLLLLGSGFKLDVRLFYGSAAAAVAALLFTGFNLNFYSTDLLIMYVLMTAYVVYVSRGVEALKAVSFAFIVVFANSYFWEFPIHVASFVETLQVGNQLIQATHIVPLALMVYTYRGKLTLLPWARALDGVLLLWMLVLGVTYLRMVWAPEGVFNLMLNHGLRWIALITLTGMIRLRPEAHAQ